MEIAVSVLFLLFGTYHVVRFIHFLVKMRKQVIFPIYEKDRMTIRKHPVKPVASPTYKGQKTGIIMYSILLLYMLALFFFTMYVENWALLIGPVLVILYFHDILNMFSITEEGLLVGGRFVHWKNVKSFQFKPIDMNHRYYGHAKEVNESGYELIIKHRLFDSRCIVVSEETKEKLTSLFKGNGKVVEEMGQPQEV